MYSVFQSINKRCWISTTETADIAIELASEDSRTADLNEESTILMKDITAYFEETNLKELKVGDEGDLNVIPIEGIDANSGKFKASVSDLIAF